MGNIYKVITGIGLLIGIFLVLSNFTGTVAVINTISKNAINGISVLQGRNPVSK